MSSTTSLLPHPSGVASVSVVGAGRLGRALARALRDAGIEVHGPTGRGETVARADIVVLCVPDREITSAASRISRGPRTLVGHTSGATGLAGIPVDFSIHPLQTFVGDESLPAFTGIGCAIAGRTDVARDAARRIAEALGAHAFVVDDDRRAAYHAAASIASNFLVTLEAAAEQVAAGAGLDADEARAALAPLVRQSVENWAAHGPAEALTGPIARGDEATVRRQRAAVAAVSPASLALFDVLAERTRALARTEPAPAPEPVP